jgi:tetratricopeptide (TPR) repeat protein
MNKLILSCLALLMLVFAAQAQEDPVKLAKKAAGDLRTYELDQTNNLDKLHEAVQKVEAAMTLDGAENSYDVRFTTAEVFNTVTNQIVSIRQLGIGNLEDLPQVVDPALQAFEAYKAAQGLIEKRYQEKDVMKGLRAVQTNLNNMGIYAYEEGKFDAAYQHFAGVLEAHKMLEGSKDGSMLASDEEVEEQLYITGLAALSANNIEAATPIFKQLAEAGAQKAAIYEALYKIESAPAADASLEEEEQIAILEKAYANLEEGRQQFPDDVSLLFAEINHFLRINQLDVLIEKLQAAIEKEPDNISLYSTMGNVYDNLYQRETSAGNTEKADQYFNNALDYYNQALDKKEDFTDAIYSIGALYFNKAATMTQELQKLADDFSKEGQRKYEELQTKVNAEFDQALPYFIRVEKLKPNDINTLIALKEIYARKSDFETSNEFKDRLEAAQAGEELESYFLKQ